MPKNPLKDSISDLISSAKAGGDEGYFALITLLGIVEDYKGVAACEFFTIRFRQEPEVQIPTNPQSCMTAVNDALREAKMDHAKLLLLKPKYAFH